MALWFGDHGGDRLEVVRVLLCHVLVEGNIRVSDVIAEVTADFLFGLDVNEGHAFTILEK